MVSPVNPLDRGRMFDILLNSLLEAGVDTPTLAFMLGVNPDTLSAYLLRTTTKGSLHVAPGADWIESQLSMFELVPYGLYAVTTTRQFPQVTVPGPSKWLLYLFEDDGLNGIENYNLILNIGTSGISSFPAQEFQFLMGSGYSQLIMLPPCTVQATIEGAAGYGNTNMAAYLYRVPVGVF